jgi:hypothetical protein
MCKEGRAKHERKSVRDTRKSEMEVEVEGGRRVGGPQA